jgi:putative holliday junction resolvase
LADIQNILDVVQKNDVGLIVVGLPVNMDGTMGGQVEKVREFVKELRLHTKLPIELKDERLTTVQAMEFMQPSRKTKRNIRYDSAAAALILQSYLDSNLPPRVIQEDQPPE